MWFLRPRTFAPRPPRAIAETARAILEHEGRERLTLPHLAGRLGISVPSLSRYVGCDRAIEHLLVTDGLRELADMVGDHHDLLLRARVCCRFAQRYPRLYCLMTERPPSPPARRSGQVERGAP